MKAMLRSNRNHGDRLARGNLVAEMEEEVWVHGKVAKSKPVVAF